MGASHLNLRHTSFCIWSTGSQSPQHRLKGESVGGGMSFRRITPPQLAQLKLQRVVTNVKG